jgi:Na+/H+ antiporter NhaA
MPDGSTVAILLSGVGGTVTCVVGGTTCGAGSSRKQPAVQRVQIRITTMIAYFIIPD